MNTKLIELIKDAEMLDIIRDLERCQDKKEKRLVIEMYLGCNKISNSSQEYPTGINLYSEIGNPPYIGIGSHYDVVKDSPGANDNASAIAVTIDVLRKIKENPLKKIGARGFFFDEEESGLIGSRAYVEKYDKDELLGVYNMELVGNGYILALWSVDSKQDTLLLRTLESEARKKGVQTIRFPRIIANSADHMSFRKRGLEDCFTITMISEEDLKMAPLYYQALNQGFPPDELWEIMKKAPVFRHYHKSTDKSEHLDPKTLGLVSDLLYNSVRVIDENYK